MSEATKIIFQLEKELSYLRSQLAAARKRVLLTPTELADLCTFSFGVSCDAPDEASDVLLGYLPEHENGPGWYAWLAEYPEEGSVPLKRDAARAAEPSALLPPAPRAS